MSKYDARRFCDRVRQDPSVSNMIDGLERGEAAFGAMSKAAAPLGYEFTAKEMAEVVGDLIEARERLATEDLVRRVDVSHQLPPRGPDPKSAGWSMEEHWQVAANRH